MKYYIDVTLLPDTDITLGFIWQKVYQQIHIMLVENKVAENTSAVALSFPQYKGIEKGSEQIFPLGNKLRLLADTEQALETLAITTWLKRFTDHTHITSIKTVPASVNEYICFSRKQVKTNISRLARRRAKRHNESFEQALNHYASFADEQTKLPFINVKSLSQNEGFKLFIEQKLVKKPNKGEFNCYGLSSSSIDKKATVPWF